MNKRVIGISGLAGSGKDTFVDLLQKKIPNVKRFALADALKIEINPVLIKQYNIDIFKCDRTDKEKVRHLLVAHGKTRRMDSEGRYWINILNNKINTYLEENSEGIACVTDIRYDFFKHDEASWIKDDMNGILVHISQYQNGPNGSRIFKQPPNADEAENDPKLIAKANYKVIWPRLLKDNDKIADFDRLNIYVDEFIKYLHR